MTLSTMTLDEAAALVPLRPDKLATWAELGLVPGATHAGKGKHWRINRDAFMLGLPALQERLKRINDNGRDSTTGLPFVADHTPEVEAELRELAEIRKATSLVVDVGPVTTLRTVQEHLDADMTTTPPQCAPWQIPTWAWCVATATATATIMKGCAW